MCRVRPFTLRHFPLSAIRVRELLMKATIQVPVLCSDT